MAQNHESSRGPAWSATIWPLITGLAVGFLVGRETGGHGSAAGGGGEVAAEKASDKVPAGTKMPAKIFKSESEFPDGWMKEADLASVTSVSFTGLTGPQKVTALQALNERDCECGCGMGKIAGCLKKDPNCPRSPNMAKLAIDMAKQGKPIGESWRPSTRSRSRPGRRHRRARQPPAARRRLSRTHTISVGDRRRPR